MTAALKASRRATAADRRMQTPGVKSWLWAGIQLALLGGEIFLLLSLLAQPAFRPRQVELIGSRHLGSSEVAAALGLPEERSIFLVSHRSLETRLGALPWLQSGRVSLGLPDRVTVVVTEWAPVAILQQGERSYYLGARGSVLGAADEAGSLPILERPGLTKIAAGTGAIEPELLQLLLSLREGFPKAFHLQVMAFKLDADDNLTLRTDRGWNIVFGRMTANDERVSLEAKLAALQALATTVDLPSAPIAYINLMNPQTPAVQMRGH